MCPMMTAWQGAVSLLRWQIWGALNIHQKSCPMITRFIYLLTSITAFGLTMLLAQEDTTKAKEGVLRLGNKTYHLAYALVYESSIDDEDAVVVVLSGQPVAGETLKQAREAEKDGAEVDFKKPFLKLVFKKTGELKYWSAAASGTTIGRHGGDKVTARLQVRDGRATGKASQLVEADAMIPTAFDVRFNVGLLKAGEELPASTPKQRGPAAKVKPTVTGVFKGNGKDAKLAYVSARWGEPFGCKPGIVLIFTEKDHSEDSKPEIDAVFGKFGSALIVSLHEDGDIYGCEVAHNAMQKKGFSSLGNIETSAFNYDNGKAEGELTTNGPVDTFGEKWEVKLQFVAPLGEIPKEFQVAEPTSAEGKEEPAVESADTEKSDQATESNSAAAGGGLPAKDLALTKDAIEVHYNPVVEQLQFESKSDVKRVCAELATNLKAHGWTNEGADLISSTSSILKRKRGEAAVTIFVKPANGGSEVKMMTEGLSWEGQ